MTEGGTLYSWGEDKVFLPGSQVPGGLGYADLRHRLVPVSLCLLGGARIRRCHGLAKKHALAFAMGTHARACGWGRGRTGRRTGAGGGRGGCSERRSQGKGMARVCVHTGMAGELVRLVVEACRWEMGREVRGGVARLMEGRGVVEGRMQ